MTSPTKARPLNIVRLLQQVHAAQAGAAAIDPLAPAEEIERRTHIEEAVNTAVSVIAIYIKLGPEPKVSPRHWEGVQHFYDVLAECGPNLLSCTPG
jgi:hypothetical protein